MTHYDEKVNYVNLFCRFFVRIESIFEFAVEIRYKLVGLTLISDSLFIESGS